MPDGTIDLERLRASLLAERGRLREELGVTCGKPIAPERLEAIPWAPTCIDCARKAGR